MAKFEVTEPTIDKEPEHYEIFSGISDWDIILEDDTVPFKGTEAERDMEMMNLAGLYWEHVGDEMLSRWKWKVEGIKEIFPGHFDDDGAWLFVINNWGVNHPVVVMSAAQLENWRPHEGLVSWLARLTSPAWTALSEQEWMLLPGGSDTVVASGGWTNPDEAELVDGPLFPQGQIVEARLRRTDTSEEALAQRVTKIYQRIREVTDRESGEPIGPPTVQILTLTIEPGHLVSTTGIGTGATAGSVILEGLPTADTEHDV